MLTCFGTGRSENHSKFAWGASRTKNVKSTAYQLLYGYTTNYTIYKLNALQKVQDSQL
jgi:hypothetical protein